MAKRARKPCYYYENQKKKPKITLIRNLVINPKMPQLDNQKKNNTDDNHTNNAILIYHLEPLKHTYTNHLKTLHKTPVDTKN